MTTTSMAPEEINEIKDLFHEFRNPLKKFTVKELFYTLKSLCLIDDVEKEDDIKHLMKYRPHLVSLDELIEIIEYMKKYNNDVDEYEDIQNTFDTLFSKDEAGLTPKEEFEAKMKETMEFNPLFTPEELHEILRELEDKFDSRVFVRKMFALVDVLEQDEKDKIHDFYHRKTGTTTVEDILRCISFIGYDVFKENRIRAMVKHKNIDLTDMQEAVNMAKHHALGHI